MYADKPVRGSGLRQVIDGVNRFFRDKPSGLVMGLVKRLRWVPSFK